jgi:homoserine O-acetyltransferase
LCAIGSTHHRLDFLIGPGRALDPSHMRIIAIDSIGNGLTTSPSNSRRQYGMAFPGFSIRDMVRSQKLLLESLKIEKADVVIGASMGGMQALQWGTMYPDATQKIIALTPLAKTTPWAAAVNQAARQSLLGRLGDHAQGKAYPPDIWDGWIPIMQLLAMRTPAQVDQELHTLPDFKKWLATRTEWWKLQHFDPVDWIYQSRAYDSHDLGSTPGFHGDTVRALQAISAQVLIITPTLDLYNPAESGYWAANHIRRCVYSRVDTMWGHLMASSADAQSARFLNVQIAQFLT